MSRLAAGQLLGLVLDKYRPLDEAMKEETAFSGLSGADRAFARAIVSTALRHAGWIDRAVQPFLSRPLAATGPEIRALIRAGAAQLWFMKTPPHAAVSETVEAARLWPQARSGGRFLNAVLRRISENTFPADRLTPLELWPDWFAHHAEMACGQGVATCLANSQLEEPRLHLSARTSPSAVAAQTGGKVLDCGTVELCAGHVESLAGYDTGEWWVQDAAARLPARLLSPGPGDLVLDLCAAPGGKTLQLAAAGASVIAVDRSRPRLDRLQENLDRTGLKAQIVLSDVASWNGAARFSKILLDAPCSALGTLRRHPEGPWIKTLQDIRRFPQIQERLLHAAADLLQPGGTLVYSVCTPLPEEGRNVIESFLSASSLKRHPVTAAEVPGFEASLTPEGDCLTLPQTGRQHDSFFICRLTRPA